MLFQLAALIDATMASLKDPVLLAFKLPEPEVFGWILFASLAATAAGVPFLVHHERRARAEMRATGGKPGLSVAA
jgi:hypothetical protein